jgi:hypothetical protein
MTTYALDARTTNESAREETPLRFRAYSAVYAALAVLVLAFLALLPVVALA